MRTRNGICITLTVCAALAILAPVPSSAGAPTPTFPPDVDGIWWDHLPPSEPALWTKEALKGFRSRWRLSISGINRTSVVVRIDEAADGRASGVLTTMRGRTPASRTSMHRFRPSERDMALLRDRLAAARLWTMYPEHWVNEDVCIDGEQLVFERRDQAGYRVSEAVAQCTAPAVVLAAAQSFLDIAGQPRLGALLH